MDEHQQGMMHEEYEHPLLDFTFPLPPLRFRESDVGTQTLISTLVNAPHPDKPSTVVDLTYSPPCIHNTRTYNPNIECEWLIHPEYINIYNNILKIDKSNDPGRMLSPMADRAFIILTKRIEQNYNYAMQHRDDLLRARFNDSTEEKLEWLRKSNYFDRTTRPSAANNLGHDTVDLWVMKKGKLTKLENVTSDHIMNFEMDGQAFDATRITTAVLLKYHLKCQPWFSDSELEPRTEEQQTAGVLSPDYDNTNRLDSDKTAASR